MTNGTNNPANPSGAPPLSAVELRVLEACHEATLRRQELLPLLARALGVPEEQVLYTWALRRCRQRGQLEGTDWGYFFHGLECDLHNPADGRHLRFDFGPRGRVDTFTLWGVLQFIMTAAAPWPDFTDLQRTFARSAPPFDPFSGSWEKLSSVWDSLEARGVFAQADPALVAFQARYTAKGPDGINYLRFPPETREETQVDCSVAHRTILSPLGRQLVDLHRANRFIPA